MDTMSDLLPATPSRSHAEQRPRDQVFFAILPDAGAGADAARTARMLCTRNGLTGVQRARRVLHISLLGMGPYAAIPQVVLEAAHRAAAAVVLPPFDLEFDRAASFGGTLRWPVVLYGGEGDNGARMLRRALISQFETVGFAFKTKPFIPHMTLLYDRRQIAEQSVEPIRWRVREFALIHSLHGHTQHIPLARWKLRG